MKILHSAIAKSLIDLVREDIVRLIGEAENFNAYDSGVWKLQSGIGLSHCNTVSMMVLTAQLQDITKQPCDLDKCSARLQAPNGEKQLRWHQDYSPMQLNAGEDGIVAWLPLDQLDGTRPSLEVASPCKPFDHETDKYLFKVIQDGDFIGQILSGIGPGDVILFSPFAPHRTYIAPGMTNSRLSLDMRFSSKWVVQ